MKNIIECGECLGDAADKDECPAIDSSPPPAFAKREIELILRGEYLNIRKIWGATAGAIRIFWASRRAGGWPNGLFFAWEGAE